jgi:hypothetical protein
MRKVWLGSVALFAAGLAAAPQLGAAGNSAKDAMVFSAAIMPPKYHSMTLGWFFFNLYMTQAYAEKADDLTYNASGRLFKLAAEKETNALLSQYEKDVEKQKGKKRQSKRDEANQFMESKYDALDTQKQLDEDGKKQLGLALLETAVALRMEQLVVRGGTAMLDNMGSIQAEAKASGNALAAAKTVSKVGGAAKTLPGTVNSAKNGIVRLEKITKLLIELGKHNKVNAPSEKETAEAEQNYVSEIQLEE